MMYYIIICNVKKFKLDYRLLNRQIDDNLLIEFNIVE